MAWGDTRSWRPLEITYVDEPIAANAVVVEETRRWIVYLDVTFTLAIISNNLGEYHGQRRALHAARIIERNARRGVRAFDAEVAELAHLSNESDLRRVASNDE